MNKPHRGGSVTPAETAEALRRVNAWRRGSEDIPMLDPFEIGRAIDVAVELLDEIERLRTQNAVLMDAANPAAISELLDRLEAAEKKSAATMMLADRLALALNTSNHERDELRAKIEQMERQEPVAEMVEDEFGKCIKGINYWWHLQDGTKLYTLLGAKGEAK